VIIRQGKAAWTGGLEQGDGPIESEKFSTSYFFARRFEKGDGVRPEERIGDAHGGCYSRALAHELEEAGYTPVSVRRTAGVHFDPEELAIPKIELRTKAPVQGIDEERGLEVAVAGKDGCSVSKAPGGTEIRLASARFNA